MVSIRLESSTEIRIEPNNWQYLNRAYYRDLESFIATHPENVSSQANGTLLKVDVDMHWGGHNRKLPSNSERRNEVAARFAFPFPISRRKRPTSG